jgi:biopolymer transport protein TolR
MRKIRKFKVQPTLKPTADINVTPLVDVVLVLLIIFMVLTPLLDKMIRVRVPDAEETQDQPKQEDNSTQLVVSVDADGVFAINSEKLSDDEFPARLGRAVAARVDRLVFFMADDAAKYPRLVNALDIARRSGAEILTMTTEPSGGGSETTTVEPAKP